MLILLDLPEAYDTDVYFLFLDFLRFFLLLYLLFFSFYYGLLLFCIFLKGCSFSNWVPHSILLLGVGINYYGTISMNMLNTCKYKSPKQILPLSFRPYGHHPMVALDTFSKIYTKCSQIQKPSLPLLPLFSVNS